VFDGHDSILMVPRHIGMASIKLAATSETSFFDNQATIKQYFFTSIIPSTLWIHASWSITRRRWSRVSVLAFGTKVRGFTPGRSRRIFRAKKILSRPSFGEEIKSAVQCRSFTAFKRSLNVTWKSAFRQNLPNISRPQLHLPPLGWSRVVIRVETPGSEIWNV
jgi:hypothetical protein